MDRTENVEEENRHLIWQKLGKKLRRERGVEFKSDVLQGLGKGFLMLEESCCCVLQRDARSEFGVHRTLNCPDYGFKRHGVTSKQ